MNEVLNDITEYLSTVRDEVFQHRNWTEEMKEGLGQVISGLRDFKDTSAKDLSGMDQPSFLLHRK